MTTKDVPNLDATLLLFDKHIPTTIARTVDVVASASKGAANGVAPLTASQHLPVANHVAGGVLNVHYTGGAWPTVRGTYTEPCPRTDVALFLDAPAGTAKPAWFISTIDHYDTF